VCGGDDSTESTQEEGKERKSSTMRKASDMRKIKEEERERE